MPLLSPGGPTQGSTGRRGLARPLPAVLGKNLDVVVPESDVVVRSNMAASEAVVRSNTAATEAMVGHTFCDIFTI